MLSIIRLSNLTSNDQQRHHWFSAISAFDGIYGNYPYPPPISNVFLFARTQVTQVIECKNGNEISISCNALGRIKMGQHLLLQTPSAFLGWLYYLLCDKTPSSSEKKKKDTRKFLFAVFLSKTFYCFGFLFLGHYLIVMVGMWRCVRVLLPKVVWISIKWPNRNMEIIWIHNECFCIFVQCYFALIRKCFKEMRLSSVSKFR